MLSRLKVRDHTLSAAEVVLRMAGGGWRLLRVEVILGGGEGDQEQETKTLTFTFYEPLTESGRAMVQVSERDTVMGVETADVDAILGNLEELRAEPADDSTAASE